MPTLFDAQTYQDVVRRIESLRPDSARQWGKMSPTQALEHLSRVLEMAMGRGSGKQIFLGKLISWKFRAEFLGEKPFRKNSPTGPDYIVKGEPDFAATQARILRLVGELHTLGARGCDGNVHAFFGPMKGEEWGVTQFKHLDHHLRQFGV